MRFEWDESKAKQNAEKHGASFTDATTVFHDPFSLTVLDPLHSVDETRWVTIGEPSDNELLVVVHINRDGVFRIISAREATRRERQNYAQRKPNR